ncbi:MAG: protoporphyrinogen oxidase HemJ [Hyphomicrobiaceae bacterium]
MKDDTSSPAFRAGIAVAITAVAAVAAMLFFGRAAYEWVKAIHVMAIISWMAGMLYLPRIFVYHCEAETGSEPAETFKVMERRLLRIIINPAMIIAWVTGLWLAWQSGFWAAPWFHVKFLAVLVMAGVHGYFSAATRAFAEDRNTRTARHWRLMNEAPAVLMIIIVIMVIVKPF